MNRGTRIRGIALILALVLTGLALFDILTMLVAKIIIFIFLVLATTVGYYWNEDFTEASCHGTGITRQIKEELKDNYLGEKFYTLPLDSEITEEVEVLDE
jgi:hypothetical protein